MTHNNTPAGAEVISHSVYSVLPLASRRICAILCYRVFAFVSVHVFYGLFNDVGAENILHETPKILDV